jgi:hypothetical protein
MVRGAWKRDAFFKGTAGSLRHCVDARRDKQILGRGQRFQSSADPDFTPPIPRPDFDLTRRSLLGLSPARGRCNFAATAATVLPPPES